MSTNETKLQPKRQRLTEEFLERYKDKQPVSRLVESNTALEKQFQFPKEVWEKLKAR